MTKRAEVGVLVLLAVAIAVGVSLRWKPAPAPDPCAPLAAWKPMYSGDGHVAGLVCYAVNPPRVAAFR